MFVATVSNIDWPRSSHESGVVQRAELDDLVATLSATRVNAVVFQVRPAADALYNSAVEPWSAYVRALRPVDVAKTFFTFLFILVTFFTFFNVFLFSKRFFYF